MTGLSMYGNHPEILTQLAGLETGLIVPCDAYGCQNTRREGEKGMKRTQR